MKLWKENRLDQEWEMSNKEIATKFKKSKFYEERYEKYRGTADALISFISEKEGLNSLPDCAEGEGSIDESPDILQILKLIDKNI